jgi:hypothetical protein
MTHHRLFIGLLCLIPLLLVLIKPAVVKTEDHTGMLILFRWQSGTIQFVNSVTGKPVTLHFKVGGRFQEFSMSTDETTEAYYTHGLYDLNRVASHDATDVLRFCSIKGIRLTLGFHHFHLKNGCLEVKLVWTL